MLPWLIIAAVAVPLLVISFAAARRSKASGEHPVPEDERTKERTAQEFAEAEEYQEQWREEEKKHPRDRLL